MAEYIEQNKLTCRDCYHHDVCDGFGFVLDPLHGGVICDSFVKAADVVEVVHGRWIEEHFGTMIPVEYDDNGNVIVHDCVNYRCNLCGRIENEKEPFCNCGARMDGE